MPGWRGGEGERVCVGVSFLLLMRLDGNRREGGENGVGVDRDIF